jgi:PRTRC genetic system protein A
MKLMTKIYYKESKDFQWPTDKLFYLVASNGYFICRNHGWFRTCVPTDRGPAELEEQETCGEFNYPQIPKLLFEQAIRFFRYITRHRGWESALILVWNKQTESMELVCPDQKASSGSVNYDIPNLPPHLMVIGDLHSHCDFNAFASGIDKDDEVHRPGLHVIIGLLSNKVPDYYCGVVVDSERFDIDDLTEVVEDFANVDTEGEDCPKEWVDKVQKHAWTWTGGFKSEPNRSDKKKIAKALKKFETYTKQPSHDLVRSTIWQAALSASWEWCEQEAKAFIDQWGNKSNEEPKTNIPKFDTQA